MPASKNVYEGDAVPVRDCIVHYGEIALKGRNQGVFKQSLVGNIRHALCGLGGLNIQILPGRIWIEFPRGSDWEQVAKVLAAIPGISWFARGHRLEASLHEVQKILVTELPKIFVHSFAVRAKRGEPHFPLGGQTVNEQMGAFIQKQTGWRVDLENPDITFYLELLTEHIFLYWEKVRGLGGMPVGMGGRVVALLSGGIDSPVAAFRMIRKGCKVTFVHFHSAPFTTEASQEKVWELAEHLGRLQGGGELVLIPFGELQREIVAKTPERFRVLLYRRLMLRIATKIARDKKALALVTGESLGQVASQTLKNLSVIETATDLPVLRPLIGMDKQEIVDEAKRIGTYEISIRPHEDCCSFMLPQHPATGAPREVLQEAEGGLEVAALTAAGCAKAVAFSLNIS